MIIRDIFGRFAQWPLHKACERSTLHEPYQIHGHAASMEIGTTASDSGLWHMEHRNRTRYCSRLARGL